MGPLTRKKVKPGTQTLYQTAIDEFRARSGVPDSDPLPKIDKLWDQRLVRLYLAGKCPAPGRILFYATVWHLCVRPKNLPLAEASSQGHARDEKTKLELPFCLENFLLMAMALLMASMRVLP